MTFTLLRIKLVSSIPSSLLLSRPYRHQYKAIHDGMRSGTKFVPYKEGLMHPGWLQAHHTAEVLAFAPRALSIAGKHILGQNRFLFKCWRWNPEPCTRGQDSTTEL